MMSSRQMLAHAPLRRPIRWILASTIVGITIIAILAANEPAQDTEKPVADGATPLPATACVRQIEKREVRGTSMSGLLEPGREIKILHGYYDCNPVRRGDIVVFRYSGNLGDDLYWIKTAQGLPGDHISLGEKGQAGKRVLLINGQPVANPAGRRYRVDKIGESYIRLAIHQHMTDQKIPRGRYLMLGTAAVGGWDSRRVGLIAHMSLIGKAVVE